MQTAARWAVAGLLVSSILILAFALGYVVRGGDASSPSPPPVTGSSDDDRDIDFATLNEIARLLQENYVEPDRIDQETLYDSAISGMLQTLSDTGTFYVDPETVQISIGPSGSFDGIGATVSEQNGEIVIVAPIEDTPAERAGLQSGDVILEVDGESTEGWTQERAVIRIRGPRGTTVTLKVRHLDGTEEVIDIVRDEIRIQSVTTVPPGGTLQDADGNPVNDVGYLYVREFGERTAQEVVDAIEEFKDAGHRGMILDLRNNPGGLLRATIDVADEFLDGGVILSERERSGKETSFAANPGGAAVDIPVVVLINRFSASGAEVLAAALQDNGRATVVGETSFGKGTVNVSKGLRDGGELYVSVAKWLTPSGLQIDGVGVRPDITVELSDDDIDNRRDSQLFRAIDVLLGADATATAGEPALAAP
jgi:carboxyl-terminal processing protease